MPKMFIHAPQGLLDEHAREEIATELMDLGLTCENLPKTPFVKSTVWCYFADYAVGAVFAGGARATSGITSLIIYTLRGGLGAAGKRDLIAGATEILGRHSGAEGRIPAFVVIREVPAIDWGMFGEPGSLQRLRDAPPDMLPL